MPRHNALIPLSHDHHHGLVMALRLKKGGPASPNDRWPLAITEQLSSLMDFALTELLPHFSLEEEILFPFLRSFDDQRINTLILQLQTEHRRMREMLQTMTADISVMREFGRILEAHIRTEERQLFPVVETFAAEYNITLPIDQIIQRHRQYEKPAQC